MKVKNYAQVLTLMKEYDAIIKAQEGVKDFRNNVHEGFDGMGVGLVFFCAGRSVMSQIDLPENVIEPFGKHIDDYLNNRKKEIETILEKL